MSTVKPIVLIVLVLLAAVSTTRAQPKRPAGPMKVPEEFSIQELARGLTAVTAIEIAPDGRVVSVNGINVMSEMTLGVGGASSFVIAVLPDTAVKPGDSWSKSYDQPSPFGTGSTHVTANSKYLRDETFHGVKAAVVETNTSANIDLSMTPTQQGAAGGFPGTSIKGKWTTDVTSWIDPSAHRLLKTLMKGTTDITMTTSVQPGPPIASADGSPVIPPGISGPFTMKGLSTLDLEPA